MKSLRLVFLFYLFIGFSGTAFLYGQKIETGSVLFSWDKAGDVTLIVRYRGEELQPLGGLHFHTGGYERTRGRAQLRKVTRAGQLFAASCYQYNKIKLNWWEYFKSFFWEPERLGHQKFTLFDDGSGSYEGRGGGIERLFRKGAHDILKEFELLQQLRAISA